MKHRRKSKDTIQKRKSESKSRNLHPLPSDIKYPANPVRDLPPNETIRKHPDEVYGDTVIPHRRRPRKPAVPIN